GMHWRVWPADFGRAAMAVVRLAEASDVHASHQPRAPNCHSRDPDRLEAAFDRELGNTVLRRRSHWPLAARREGGAHGRWYGKRLVSLVEVDFEPDQRPAFVSFGLGAPSIGERLDEVKTVADRAGWP